MQIRTEVTGGIEVARFIGRIDGDAAAGVRAAAELSRTLPVAFDLSGVDFMDSAGLGALVVLIRSYRDAGVPCVLAGATPLVAQILRVTAIHQLVPVTPTMEQAMTTLLTRKSA
jgi:anti-sigma B factor antagonist